jgi:GT2 family glycosyltransferase
MSTPSNNPPKIAIILLNWNGKQDTLACLESLEKLTYPHVETILVDNGSTDGSVAAIRERYPELQILETGSNLGFAGGNNVGIAKALDRGADLFFLLNNDTVVASSILEAFVEEFEAHPEAGILGAQIFLFDQQDTLDHLGGKWNRKTGQFAFVGKGQKQCEERDVDYVCGAGLIIRRSVLEAIGLLEDRFFLIWEEADFCFRAKRAGFEVMSCKGAHLWHKVSASFVGGKPHSTYFWWRGRLLWMERNCSFAELISLYLRVIIPDVLHMLKIRGLKKLQLGLQKQFKPGSDVREKELKLVKNRAALCGVWDYLLRRFGSGPAWIYQKRKL